MDFSPTCDMKLLLKFKGLEPFSVHYPVCVYKNESSEIYITEFSESSLMVADNKIVTDYGSIGSNPQS